MVVPPPFQGPSILPSSAESGVAMSLPDSSSRLCIPSNLRALRSSTVVLPSASCLGLAPHSLEARPWLYSHSPSGFPHSSDPSPASGPQSPHSCVLLLRILAMSLPQWPPNCCSSTDPEFPRVQGTPPLREFKPILIRTFNPRYPYYLTPQGPTSHLLPTFSTLFNTEPILLFPTLWPKFKNFNTHYKSFL